MTVRTSHAVATGRGPTTQALDRAEDVRVAGPVSDPSDTAAAVPRPPDGRPARTIKVAAAATAVTGGRLTVEIRVGAQIDRYLVGPVDTGDFGGGLVGFEVQKVPAAPEGVGRLATYHVLLDTVHGRHSCECLGHLKHGHGKLCRHVAGLFALYRAGRLTTARDARRGEGPESWDGYEQWLEQQAASFAEGD